MTEISTGLSLTLILEALVVTALASLFSKRGRAQNAISNARRHAISLPDTEYTADPAKPERAHLRALLAERDQIVTFGPEYRQMVRDEADLMDPLERALASHHAAVGRGEATPIGSRRA